MKLKFDFSSNGQRCLQAIFSIVIIGSFFLPWFYFEVLPVKGYMLRWYAAEYFTAGSWQMRLVFGVYLVPIGGIYLLLSSILNVSFYERKIKWLIVFLMTATVGLWLKAALSINLVPGSGLLLTMGAIILLIILKTPYNH